MVLKKQKPLPRGAGVLLPVSSLPSRYGIGTFGRAAYRFVDFLQNAGQRYWQVLPLGPTSFGDSPYQSFSAFAGNPYFIDLDFLVRQGLLQEEELAGLDWGDDPASGGSPAKVDYGRLFENRFGPLRLAYERSGCESDPAFAEFCGQNAFWLQDYADYMAIKARFGNRSWVEWPDELRLRREDALLRCRERLAGEIGMWKFFQYQFHLQWQDLKEYANRKGVRIIGDIPIYVALDSADTWVKWDQFQMDGDRRPVAVAGVPPDLFSATGQLWGNPLYDWDAMERDGFAWWRQRMRASASLYDVIRIDHFIGIVRYYSIPAQAKTAQGGAWRPGPGKKLLAALSPSLGDTKIIAEDLGCVTPAVIRLKNRAGYPGMKLMEFAFDGGAENENLPIHFERNCVAYGGTHDNETLRGFFKARKAKDLEFGKRYLHISRRGDFPDAVIRAGYESVANTVIFQMQDLLGLDNGARMNFPSTIGGNWQWRAEPGQFTGKLAQRLHTLAETYGRTAPAAEAGAAGAASHGKKEAE